MNMVEDDVVEFYDLGNNRLIIVRKDTIERFTAARDGKGTLIFLISGGNIWVRESYTEVKEKLIW